MADSGIPYFVIALVLLSLISQQGTWGTIADNAFPSLTDGRTVLYGFEADPENPTSETAFVTDYYDVYTTFKNPDEGPKNLVSVFFVLTVIDQDGYTTYLDMNTYGNHTVAGSGAKDYHLSWIPPAPGNHTIKSFLISGLEHPQILTDVVTSHVMVKEKIVVLGEGQSNNRLLVESINQEEKTVNVVSNYCEENSYEPITSATLKIGEYFSVKAVDAYLLGIREDGKAFFRFEANGAEDYCLI